MLEPVKKTRLYEDITDQLLGLIKGGSLKPGDRLPSERQLSEELKVSRTAIREALRSMESIGYLNSRPGEGTFVRSVTLDNVITPFSVMLAQDKKLMRELVHVREILETEIAALAAKNITPEGGARLDASIEHMREEIAAGGNGLSGDNEFHNELADIADNSAMTLILELCSELLSQSRAATLDIPGQPKKSLIDHARIAAAVKEGSDKNAAKLMRQHIRKAMKNLDEKLDGGK